MLLLQRASWSYRSQRSHWSERSYWPHWSYWSQRICGNDWPDRSHRSNRPHGSNSGI